jgi:hypothetical protein
VSTWYGSASIAFGAFIFATAIYAVFKRDWRTVGLGLLAGAILVVFGIWLLGQ